jgi:hypothetical protein
MSSLFTSTGNQPNRAAVHTLKNLLLHESDDDKIHLLSLLRQLTIKTDSIEYDNQNSKSSRANYNNSHIPFEADNLSALYAHYKIDPQVYPPPDLRFYNTIEQSIHPSRSYLQLSTRQNNGFLERRRRNSSQSSRVWKRKQNRLKHNKNRKKENKRQETDDFRRRNTITVRQISCHDMLDPQTIIKKRREYHQHNLEKRKCEFMKFEMNTMLICC